MTIPEAEQVPTSRKKREKWGTRLNQIPYDPEFTPGARNAETVWLRVQPSARVCVITDEATLAIAAAIVHELETMDAPYHSCQMSQGTEHTITGVERSILDDLEKSQVS